MNTIVSPGPVDRLVNRASGWAGALLIFAACRGAFAGLEVADLGKTYKPDDTRVVVKQTDANAGGNTSVRNIDAEHLEWKENGYFQRNRDLGQVLTAEKDFRLEGIVLRTGPADGAVLAGMPGAKVFVQFFEVTGEPRINDNGTPKGATASRGFTTNHRADDFLEGVEYKPLRVARGGVFPKVPPTRDAKGQPVKAEPEAGRLRYLRWRLTGDDQLLLEKGKRYAFMVGIETPGPERGFTLANHHATRRPMQRQA